MVGPRKALDEIAAVDEAQNGLLTAEVYWAREVILADVHDLPRSVSNRALGIFDGQGRVDWDAQAADAVGGLLNAALRARFHEAGASFTPVLRSQQMVDVGSGGGFRAMGVTLSPFTMVSETRKAVREVGVVLRQRIP